MNELLSVRRCQDEMSRRATHAAAIINHATTTVDIDALSKVAESLMGHRWIR